MLYPTHRKYGQVYGFLAIPLAISLGMVPIIDLSNPIGKSIGDAIIITLYLLVAYRGSLFGAEFPDSMTRL